VLGREPSGSKNPSILSRCNDPARSVSDEGGGPASRCGEKKSWPGAWEMHQASLPFIADVNTRSGDYCANPS
jgi:hypothetical protein